MIRLCSLFVAILFLYRRKNPLSMMWLCPKGVSNACFWTLTLIYEKDSKKTEIYKISFWSKIWIKWLQSFATSLEVSNHENQIITLLEHTKHLVVCYKTIGFVQNYVHLGDIGGKKKRKYFGPKNITNWLQNLWIRC